MQGFLDNLVAIDYTNMQTFNANVCVTKNTILSRFFSHCACRGINDEVGAWDVQAMWGFFMVIHEQENESSRRGTPFKPCSRYPVGWRCVRQSVPTRLRTRAVVSLQ